VTELKPSSKLLIYDSRHYLYCIYRAPGDWSNPNTFSLIGTDGDTLDGVLRQVREKFHLGQRFRGSNHIRRPRQACRTKCG
jgi:hypothetical protein